MSSRRQAFREIIARETSSRIVTRHDCPTSQMLDQLDIGHFSSLQRSKVLVAATYGRDARCMERIA
jgi:hypothetical protein